MKRQRFEFAVLRALIRNWKRAISHPKIAKMVCLTRSSFSTEQVRVCVLALLLNNGDIHHAIRDIGQRPPAWLPKFIKWADKVKGGA